MAFGLLTGEMIKAGRALCRIDQVGLAHRAGVSLETIKRLEQFRGPIQTTTRTVNALIQTFESLGIEFEFHAGSVASVRYCCRPQTAAQVSDDHTIAASGSEGQVASAQLRAG